MKTNILVALAAAAVIAAPGSARVWLAAGVTDMRKGMNGLAAIVQMALTEQPYSGDVFVFRGRRGDQVKLLKKDNVVTGSLPGLSDLGIEPTAAELIVPTYLDAYRRGGRYRSPLLV